MPVLAIAGAGALIAAGVDVAAVGAAATLTGVLTAASIGFSIGALAGEALFPTTTHQQGPRLSDLSVSSSTYGQIIPFGVGRIRLPGNIIWMGPVIENPHNAGGGKKGGGKGGKSGSSSTTFTYSASFAVAICEGVVQDITRIWANSTLVYDATSAGNIIQAPGLVFRFYPGSEDQVPDSIIETDKGAGNVPAFRGICYIVFDNLDLTAAFGNRLPNINVEVAFSADPQFPWFPLIRAVPSIFGSVASEAIGINPLSMRGYVAGKSPDGIIEFDLVTMQTLRETADSDILTDGSDGGAVGVPGLDNTNLLVTATGALVWSIGPSGSEGGRIIRVDQNTMKETAEFDAPQSGIFYTTSSFPWPRFITNLAYIDPTNGVVDYIVVLNIFGQVGVLKEADLTYVWGAGQALSGAGPRAVTIGRVTNHEGEAWALSFDTFEDAAGHVYFDKITVTDGAISFSQILDLLPTDVDPAADGFFGSGPTAFIFDQSDNSLLLEVVTLSDSAHLITSGQWLVKWSETGGILFVVPSPIPNAGAFQSNSFIASGNYAAFYTNQMFQIDSQSGHTILDQQWPISTPGGFTTQAYDSLHQAMFAWVLTPQGLVWAKLLLGRVDPNSATLQQCFDLVLEHSGYQPDDYDTSDLADTSVPGFVIAQLQTGANSLTQLASVFLLDSVETDYKLVFRHRGGPIAAQITEDELIRLDDKSAEPFKETRAQESDLPLIANFTYLDLGRDYQSNTVSAKRVKQPFPTMFSDQTLDVQMGLVLDTVTGQQAAEVLLYSNWIARHSFQCRLAQTYLWLDTADPIQLTLNSGLTVRLRMGKTDYGVDYTIDSTLSAENDGQYTSFAQASPPPLPPPPPMGFFPAELLLLDAPLLMDTNEVGPASFAAFWGASAFSNQAFSACELDESNDLSVWTRLDTSATGATWGHIHTPPADPDSMFHTQRDGSLTVDLQQGGMNLGSITDLQLANGGNAAILIKTNGEVEIIQYRDVVALGNNLYKFSFLNRGRRGTDTMGGGHVAGEVFVNLDPTSIRQLTLPASGIDKLEWWRAVSFGTLPALALPQSFTFHGRDKMPYAPVSIAGAISGSDIVLTWDRRSRFAGDLKDGTGTVPLDEATEAYEVDILSAPGGSVLRTLTGITSPTVTYTAAHITADFGSIPSELSVVIYQMSAIVGRGFPGIATVEIA